MMSDAPAFPCEWNYIGSNRSDANGMLLRDYFAAKCDVSLYTPLENLKKKGFSPTVEELADYIARIRYCEADAMLKVRKGI